ncbi:MAG: hypothetical protein F2605_02520 [Actinobacteria bacterium]|nr:hypothetical protein [Actinomycetota bacterium]
MHVMTERGSASLEFIVASIALFVPLVALTVTTSQIASATFAATTAARHGVRAFTRAASTNGGLEQVRAITALIIDDHGLTDTTPQWELDCSRRNCLQRGSLVTLTVHLDVPSLFIPALPGIDIAPRVTVSRSATARVSLTSVNR